MSKVDAAADKAYERATVAWPADYVTASTSPEGSSPNLSAGYGRLWWVGTENGHRTFSARGLGGQYIVVVPDLDLVVVVTSDVEAPGLDSMILISGLVAAV
jgi:CubicO group peptidase (beta-lactamase class C family)